MFRTACCLLVVAAVLSPAAAASTAATDGSGSRTPEDGTVTPTEPATPEVTVIASDGTFAGFTVGAAILAVLLAGTYRYLRD